MKRNFVLGTFIVLAVFVIAFGILSYVIMTCKPNYKQLTTKVDIVKNLDQLNDSAEIKYLHVFNHETQTLSIVDTIETPVLFNDLDSTLFINNHQQDFKIYKLSTSSRIIISDEVLSLDDIFYNKKEFVVL